MKRMRVSASLFLGGAMACACAPAQTPAPQGDKNPPAGATAPMSQDPGPVPLEWVPPALSQLSAQAAAKSSFTLDRDMLTAAASLLPDSDASTRQTVAKLDGVSVHLLRFGGEGTVDPGQVEAIREAYHLRGWKHLVTTTNAGGPVHNGAIHNGTTDVWLVLDGANIRGAVVLAETPKSLTLVTVAGNVSPVDILRLRGHFGIPRFEGDGWSNVK